MEFRKTASWEEARQMDIVSYLSSLGYEPAKIRNFDYWYHSPLRDEKTPSFKVNRKLNKWYDHGIGKGGNLIDFAILYNNCTIGEFLKRLGNNLSFHQPISTSLLKEHPATDSRIKIVNERPLTSFVLRRYLYQRRIPIEVAKQFCKEVIYELSNKKYFAIGFKNNAGGYELRNSFFKGSSSPKDVTIFDNNAEEVAVLEGFFDFLSFIAIGQNGVQVRSNFLVLNSVSFFEKARPFMEQHEVINLYLDHDKTGQNCTQYALSLSKKYIDKSGLYRHYKDLNDWMMNIGKLNSLSSKGE
jgi:DNA primase